MPVSQLLQHILGSAILLGGGTGRPVGHLHPLIEHLAQLLGRTDIELHACQTVDILLYLLALNGKLRGVVLEGLHVYEHPLALHVYQHIHQRHLHLVV